MSQGHGKCGGKAGVPGLTKLRAGCSNPGTGLNFSSYIFVKCGSLVLPHF